MLFRQGAEVTEALHELVMGSPQKWQTMAKPASETGHAADARAPHTTANTLPAYNTRRFAQEEPERLRLRPLPWANKEPDRPAPSEPPRPQEPTKRLDIKGVGWLKEWKEVDNAVKSIRKDLKHSDDSRHRPRRAEGGIDAETLAPLIGDTILDTRAAQGKGGTIDWTKVTVQDWTTPTPNAAKHTNIAARAANCKDKEIFVRVGTRSPRHKQVLELSARQLAPQRRVREPKTGAQATRRRHTSPKQPSTAKHTHNTHKRDLQTHTHRRSRKC